MALASQTRKMKHYKEKSRNTKLNHGNILPEIGRKPRQASIMAPTPTEMCIYHRPYSFASKKCLPWYILQLRLNW